MRYVFKMFLYIIIMLLFVTSIEAGKRVICDNSSKITYMSTEEIIFFESVDFPKGVKDDCEIIFVVENYHNKSDVRLMFVLINGEIDRIDLSANNTRITSYGMFVTTENTELSAHMSPNSYSVSIFQGFVVANDWNTGCPLESISRINPYVFADETEILYLRSAYITKYGENKTNIRCNWNFVAPVYYSFKLVFDWFPENGTMKLITQNSEPLLLTYGNAKVHYPYRFESTYLKIFFEDISEVWNLTLEAFLSVIKINAIKNKANCTIFQNKTFIIWELSNGYENNIKCIYNLTLPSTNQYSVTIPDLDNEFQIDTLKYYTQDKIVIIDPQEKEFFLQANKNGYNSFALWEFVSDGSFVQQGFRVIFQEIECKCRDPIITVPCNDTLTTGLMNSDTYHYCGNLNCTFNITSNCSENLIAVKFLLSPVDCSNFYDYFKLTSNENILLSSKNDICNADDATFVATLSPKNKNIFEITSIPERLGKGFAITLSATERPSNLTIILSKKEPFFVLNVGALSANRIVRIEMDKDLITKSDILEIFSNLDTTTFGLLTFTNDSNYDNSIIDKKLQSGVLFFRARNAHTNGCVYKKNVFDSWNAAEYDEDIAMLANDQNESCTIVLLNRQVAITDIADVGPVNYHAITHFWTTSKHQNVKVFRGANELFVEFNSSSNDPLNAISLSSEFYIITVPVNCSVLIGLTKFTQTSLTLSFPYKALWATPFYATTGIQVVETTKFGDFTVNQEITAFIKVLVFDVSSDGGLEINGEFVTHAGQIFNASNTKFTFSVLQMNFGDTGALFEIETVQNAK